MKKNWIILSVVVISVIAFLDVRDRFAELDAIAADTNVQVEMKTPVHRSTGAGVQNKMETIEKQPRIDDKRIQQKINENTRNMNQNFDLKKNAPSGLQIPNPTSSPFNQIP